MSRTMCMPRTSRAWVAGVIGCGPITVANTAVTTKAVTMPDCVAASSCLPADGGQGHHHRRSQIGRQE